MLRWLISKRSLATIADIPKKPKKMQSNFESAILPRLNVFKEELRSVPTFGGPTTGFFRNNYCDASPLDPASHTVAAVLTPAFLKFSAAQGNDLSPLFPSSGPLSPSANALSTNPAESPCKWCICVSRWKEALDAALTHEKGEDIVPRVVLEATHVKALDVVSKEDLERFAVGGDGDGGIPDGGRIVERAGR